MNPLRTLAHSLVVTFIISGLAAVGAWSQPLSLRSAETKQTTAVVAVPHEAQPEMVFAVVVGIDYDSGMMVLDSAIGQLLTVATPTQLRALHPGDVVLVHLSREDRQKEKPQDEEPEDTLMI